MADRDLNPNGSTNDGESMPPGRRARRRRAAVGLIVLLIVVGAAWYLRSSHFNAFVKARLVAGLQRATGGRATVGSIEWNLSKMQFEMRNVTIHGNEPVEAVPLVHIERVYVEAEVLSWFRQEIRLTYLDAERPTVHIITNADGTTNIPTPKQRSAENAIEQLLRLAIGKAVAHEGLLLWNDRPVPFDFSGNQVEAQLTYVASDRHYDGSLAAGKVDLAVPNLRPIAAEARTDFTLRPGSAELRSFTASSGNSTVQASGTIDNFDHPVVKVNYSARIDVREAGLVLRRAELRGGIADVSGAATVGGATPQSEGKFTLRDGAVQWQQFHVADLSGGADFRANTDRLELRNVFARALGGSVTGAASVENWLSGLTKSAAGHPAARGTAKFDVRGFQLAAALRAISSPQLPLDRLEAMGSVAGAASAQWVGSPMNASANLSLDVAPPAEHSAHQIPVTARLVGVISVPRKSLTIAELNASTPGTRLTATGTLDHRNADLKLTVASTSFREITQAKAVFVGSEKLPIDVFGSVQFTGSVSGPLSGPAFDGHVELVNFDSIVDVPVTPPAQTVVARASHPAPPSSPIPGSREVRLHWDRGVAEVFASPSQATMRSATLQRAGGEVSGSAQASLYKYRFTDYSPFTARIEARHIELSELQRLAGTNFPVTALANISVAASGTLDDPRARGRVVLIRASVEDQPLTSVSANLDVRNHVADLTNIQVAGPPGAIVGSVSYNLRNASFSLNLHGTGIDLAKIAAVQSSRISIAGIANFTAQGSGTLAAPVVNATLRIENVVANGERVGNIALDAVTQGTEMRVTGSTRFQNAALLLNGNVHLRENFPATLHLTFSHFDIDPLLRAYLQGRVTGHSQIAGDVRIQGPLRRPRELEVAGELSEIAAEIENVKLASHEPVRFTIENAVLKLSQLHIVGDDTDVSAAGSIALTGTHALSGSAEGHFNLQVLQLVNPALRSAGTVTTSLRAGGTLTRPVLDGRVQIANGAIAHSDLPNGLSEINGTLRFSDNRLSVVELTARTGGGLVEVGGFVTLARLIDFNLSITGHDIRLRYPPGVSSMANVNLKLTGSPSNALLGGTVMITRFNLNPNFDFSVYLASARQPVAIGNPNSPFNNLHLDVHILSTPELQVQTSLARVSGDVDLRLRGTPIRPVLLGRANIVQGVIFFNGTTYQMERGDVSFNNPTRIEPILNLDLTAHIRDYDVVLGLHGPLDHLATTYRSEPPLPSSDVIALLAFGRTREDLAAPQPNPGFSDTASSAILGQAISSVVSNRVQRLFGVSRVKIDPQVGTATSNPTARVTIEQQVSNNLTLTYITDVTQAQQQVIQMEYNVNRNVSIVAVRDQYGVVSVDVRIRQRKR